MIGRTLALLIPVALACAAHSPAHGQFPDQPVRIVVGFPPGGPTDLAARVVGQAMEKRLGQSVLVDNRPGASGNIAAEYVARSPGNGYSLLLGTTSVFAINPAIGRKTPFDPAKDFVAVGLIGILPSFVIVPEGLPVRSISDLARYGRENRGKLTYASNGPGTLSHICSALISSIFDIDAVHVPYKGSAPSAQDLVSNRVSFTCDAYSAYRPFVEGGRLRVLAASTAERSALVEGVPGMRTAACPTSISSPGTRSWRPRRRRHR